MAKTFVTWFLIALMAFSAAAAEEAHWPITVIDMYDREITLYEPVTRVVALTPSDCEILCALGSEDRLVGRGAYCDYPESIQSIPVVQFGTETNLESILALAPQVVLMSDMNQTEAQVQMLEESGVKVVISDADDIAGVYEAIRMIGKLMDQSDEAEALIADMQGTFDEIASWRNVSEESVYFEVSPIMWGLWTAGAHTFMDELATLCGVTNAFADVEGWVAISEEQVLARDPDYIVTITMYSGEGPSPVEEIAGRTGWDTLKAVANGAIFNVDSDAISRPGPRLKWAALELYNCLHP